MQEAPPEGAHHSSIPPLAMDATTTSTRPYDLTLLEDIDSRTLTSIAALALALTFVCVIALVGTVTHTKATTTAQALPPLVNVGVEIPTPAINLPVELREQPMDATRQGAQQQASQEPMEQKGAEQFAERQPALLPQQETRTSELSE